MTLDTLNSLVSGAIWRAEQLEELGLETARSAWSEVSRLEEELARQIPASAGEGRISRRGAVRAALKAGDLTRAQELVDRFVAQDSAPRTLRVELRKMLKADADGLAEQFPYAARHHKPGDVQRLARLYAERGPFLLATA